MERERLEEENRQLRRQIDELQQENHRLYERISHSEFLVETELEPRIENEKKAYDRWATSPDR
jgi:hypothetical protein